MPKGMAFAFAKQALLCWLLPTLGVLMLPGVSHGQSRDIRSQAEYGSSSEAPRIKWEYYHDMWSERDVRHGRYTEWSGSDQPMVDGFYFDGMQDSTWRYWYQNGTLREQSNWEGGKQHGKTSRYTRSGRLVREQNLQGGFLHGLDYQYHRNGRVKQLAQYHQGQLHGNLMRYKANGKLRKRVQYAEGKRLPPEKEEKPSKAEPKPKDEGKREKEDGPKAKPEKSPKDAQTDPAAPREPKRDKKSKTVEPASQAPASGNFPQD